MASVGLKTTQISLCLFLTYFLLHGRKDFLPVGSLTNHLLDYFRSVKDKNAFIFLISAPFLDVKYSFPPENILAMIDFTGFH